MAACMRQFPCVRSLIPNVKFSNCDCSVKSMVSKFSSTRHLTFPENVTAPEYASYCGLKPIAYPQKLFDRQAKSGQFGNDHKHRKKNDVTFSALSVLAEVNGRVGFLPRLLPENCKKQAIWPNDAAKTIGLRTHPISQTRTRIFSTWPAWGGVASRMSQSWPLSAVVKDRIQQHTCFFPCRHVHHDRHEDGDEKGESKSGDQSVKGVVIFLQNPFDWLKNKWYMSQIRKLDPSFTLKEFMKGALQAVAVVTKCLSDADFESLDGLMSVDAIESLRSAVTGYEQEKIQKLHMKKKDFVFRKAKTWELINEDSISRINVDAFFVALKRSPDITPSMLEISMRFSREYTTQGPADWIITHVDRFQVSEFQGKYPEKQE